MGRVWDDKYVRDEKQKWRYRVQMHLEIDDEVRPFLKLETKEPWLKRMRLALLFSVRKVAARAGLSPSAYFRYEKEEAAGSITIKALRRFADALDCDLVYALRPKERKIPSDVIWDQILVHVQQHKWRHLHALMIDKLYNPEFRKELGWARNTQAEFEVIRQHQIRLSLKL